MRPVPLALAAATIGLLAALAVFAVRGWQAASVPSGPPATRPPIGQFLAAAQREPVADIIFQDADGKDRTLSEFRGKVVLINLWATWCPPCVAEMPSLDRLQAQMGTGRFALVALSRDRGGIPLAQKWLTANKLENVRAYVADHKAASALKSGDQLPVSILIDAQGREVGRVLGATEWDAPAMVERIRALMAE